jgi:hypothetical protein
MAEQEALHLIEARAMQVALAGDAHMLVLMLRLWASFRDAYDALRGPYGHSDSEDFWLALQRL